MNYIAVVLENNSQTTGTQDSLSYERYWILMSHLLPSHLGCSSTELQQALQSLRRLLLQLFNLLFVGLPLFLKPTDLRSIRGGADVTIAHARHVCEVKEVWNKNYEGMS